MKVEYIQISFGSSSIFINIQTKGFVQQRLTNDLEVTMYQMLELNLLLVAFHYKLEYHRITIEPRILMAIFFFPQTFSQFSQRLSENIFDRWWSSINLNTEWRGSILLARQPITLIEALISEFFHRYTLKCVHMHILPLA